MLGLTCTMCSFEFVYVLVGDDPLLYFLRVLPQISTNATPPRAKMAQLAMTELPATRAIVSPGTPGQTAKQVRALVC